MFGSAQTAAGLTAAGGRGSKRSPGMPPRLNGKNSARQISAGLGSFVLDTLGLTAAIEWRTRQFQKLTGVSCQLTMEPAVPVPMPEVYAETIFGFYNEALKKVEQHAT